MLGFVFRIEPVALNQQVFFSENQMPLAIHTKYVGPTNTRGARIKATCTIDHNTKWTASVAFEYGADSENRHALAAKALLVKYAPDLHDKQLWVCGNTLDNLGYVFSVYPNAFSIK